MGRIIQKSWIKIARKYNLKLKTNNYVSLCTFFFNYGKLNERLYTYFTQEMLKYNYIANNSVYVSYAHKKKDVKKYVIACEKVFKKIKDSIANNNIPLKGPERSMAFKRLNVK